MKKNFQNSDFILALEKYMKDANLCTICLSSSNSIKLICGCNLCSKACISDYYKLLLKRPKKDECICFEKTSFQNINDLCDKACTLGLNEVKSDFLTYYTEKFFEVCMICLKPKSELNELDLGVNTLKFTDNTVNRFSKSKFFKHLICDICYVNKLAGSTSQFECKICYSNHNKI